MTKKISSTFLAISIVSIIFLLFNSQSNALIVPPPPPPVPVGIPVEVNYDNDFYLNTYIYQPLARVLISKISSSLQNSLLNKIGDIVSDQAGGGKDPHFVTDWRNLILNSQGRGNDIFRSVLADTKLCSYFGDNLKTIFGANQYGGVLGQVGIQNLTNPPGTEDFKFNNNCNLNFNVDDFKQDFSKGGWEAWNQLIQPNNNIFGVFGTALQEQQAQIALEQKSTEDQAVADQGALPNRLNESGGTSASGCQSQGLLTRCVVQGKIVTPGSLFSDATKKRLEHKLESLNLNANGIENVESLILLIADSVINKVSGQLNNLLGNAGNF